MAFLELTSLALIIGSSSALSDALVSRQKWTDPQVIRGQDILLGDDDTAAHPYVHWVRAKIIERYGGAFEPLEINETEAFGENSYFRRKELGLVIGSDDGSGVMEEPKEGEIERH